MAYNEFDPAKPVVGGTVTAYVNDIVNNFKACRDNSVVGAPPGWNWTITTPGAEPDVITYSKGTERVRATFTWSSGRVSNTVWEYSSDSGSNYDVMTGTSGQETITYDGSGYPSSGAWT